MTQIEIGGFSYARPDNAIEFDDVSGFVTLHGKGIIRLAWSTLAPNEDNEVEYSE